jgi:hypothetical protein
VNYTGNPKPFRKKRGGKEKGKRKVKEGQSQARLAPFDF